LNDYSINIKPFEPVTCNANFVSYEPAIKESISGDYSLSSIEDDIDTNKIIYGYTCSVVSANQAVSDNVLSSITYKKSYNRTPIYTIGSIYPTKYLLNGAEVEMSIESTGLNSLIDYSGSKLTSDVTISLQDQDGSTITPLSKSALSFTMYSGAIITSEKYSMQQGDSVASSATIKEIMV
jgi:hypothetical protein